MVHRCKLNKVLVNNKILSFDYFNIKTHVSIHIHASNQLQIKVHDNYHKYRNIIIHNTKSKAPINRSLKISEFLESNRWHIFRIACKQLLGYEQICSFTRVVRIPKHMFIPICTQSRRWTTRNYACILTSITATCFAWSFKSYKHSTSQFNVLAYINV